MLSSENNQESKLSSDDRFRFNVVVLEEPTKH
jgi:hypothetical protein